MMKNRLQADPCRHDEELQALYDGSGDGILIIRMRDGRFLRANRSICRMLGYEEAELLSLSVKDIYPAEQLPCIQTMFQAASERRLQCGRHLPCLRKDGGRIGVDVTVTNITYDGQQCLMGFFHDVTEQKLAMEALRASENRYRLIADNVADIIWTVEFPPHLINLDPRKIEMAVWVDAILDHWRFSFVSPAAQTVFGYSAEEISRLKLEALVTPASLASIRDAMLAGYAGSEESSHRIHQWEFRTKDGALRWCEVVSSYLRDASGRPTGLLGVTRDVSARRQAERALHESENMLRGLFENLPDFVIQVDRDGTVLFSNRSYPDASRESLLGLSAYDLLVPEHRDICRNALHEAFAARQPKTLDLLDVFRQWWSARIVPLATDGDVFHAMFICTNITQERQASEALRKEQQLLRQLLDLHERERQLVAYEIHDGFAQQLTGAIFRLQAFRESFPIEVCTAHEPGRRRQPEVGRGRPETKPSAFGTGGISPANANKNPEDSWRCFDAAVGLLHQALDETRRLISGLRPPVLDELGIVEAIQYLIYEQRGGGGPAIEFDYNIVEEHLAPPLENAVFRIVQESLHNAFRHSKAERIHVSLLQGDERIRISVRDWGVGFDPDAVTEQRFGLRGIRERVRLLGGHVTIESAVGQGTNIVAEMPLIAGIDGNER